MQVLPAHEFPEVRSKAPDLLQRCPVLVGRPTLHNSDFLGVHPQPMSTDGHGTESVAQAGKLASGRLALGVVWLAGMYVRCSGALVSCPWPFLNLENLQGVTFLG